MPLLIDDPLEQRHRLVVVLSRIDPRLSSAAIHLRQAVTSSRILTKPSSTLSVLGFGSWRWEFKRRGYVSRATRLAGSGTDGGLAELSCFDNDRPFQVIPSAVAGVAPHNWRDLADLKSPDRSMESSLFALRSGDRAEVKVRGIRVFDVSVPRIVPTADRRVWL